MPNLLETQKIFWDLIAAPEGVRQGLADLPDADRRLPDGLDGLIAGDDRLSAVARLDVYANMYFYRILDILKEDFSALCAIVGDGPFHNLVTSYLIDHPSSHPSVRYLGRHLADFVARHELARDRPWLPDLARLEWAILEAFDGPDAEALPASRLQQIPAQEWPGVRFGLVPTLHRLDVRAPVHLVWGDVNAGRAVSEIAEEPTRLRVWRQELRVLHRSVSRSESVALDAVLADESFAGVCEAIAAVESEEAAPASAARILHGWFTDGLVHELR